MGQGYGESCTFREMCFTRSVFEMWLRGGGGWGRGILSHVFPGSCALTGVLGGMGIG